MVTSPCRTFVTHRCSAAKPGSRRFVLARLLRLGSGTMPRAGCWTRGGGGHASVWARVRLKVSKPVREFMAARTAEGADRSDVLWQIERDLAYHAQDTRASDAHMRLSALHLSRALILEEVDRRLGEPRRSSAR